MNIDKGFFANPKIWGPNAWNFMLSIAITYPDNPTEDDANAYKKFFMSLVNVLPCITCREHYLQNINTLSIDNSLGNSRSLSKWVVNLHNMVNRQTGKRIIAYDEAIKLYYKNHKDGTKNNVWMNAGIMVAVVIAVAITVVALKKYKEN